MRATRLFLVLLTVLLVGCNQLAPAGPYEGMTAPRFVAPLASGGSLNLSELRGKPVVLVFWATWCGPCRYEVPHVNKLYREVGDTAHVLGINAGESQAKVVEGMKVLGIEYPAVMDADGSIVRAYQAQALPLVLVLDPKGRVRYRGNAWPARINALVDSLQTQGPP